MKLNFDIIIDNLPRSFQAKKYGPKSRNLYLKRPFLYETECNLESDRIYIASIDSLSKSPEQTGIAIVCIGLQPPQEWLSKGCQILLISNVPSIFTVFNEINKIYDKFDEWDNSLRNELEADIGFDPKKIIEIGIMVLKNQIIVINRTMLVVFRSEIICSEDNELDIDVSDDYRPLTVEYSEMIKNICRLERVITVPYMSSLVSKGIKSYCNNLYPFGYFAGCISIVETHRSFRESDYALADHFFAYFQKAFVKYLQNIRSIELPGTIVLNNLLKNIPLSTEESKMLSLDAEECWICFKLREKRMQNYLPADYMYATLSALMSGSVYSTVHDDAIMGIIKLDRLKSVTNANNTLNFFQEFLQKMEYIAGLSDEFVDINQINIYLKQADYAVVKGTETYGDNNLFHFGNYSLQYMLSQCTGELSAEYLYSKGLHILIEYDRKNHTNYIETLDIYLKNEMNATRTAEELFLHRSSLLKRLNRINKLLCADLTNPDIRLYLRMCLYLLRRGV